MCLSGGFCCFTMRGIIELGCVNIDIYSVVDIGSIQSFMESGGEARDRDRKLNHRSLTGEHIFIYICCVPKQIDHMHAYQEGCTLQQRRQSTYDHCTTSGKDLNAKKSSASDSRMGRRRRRDVSRDEFGCVKGDGRIGARSLPMGDCSCAIAAVRSNYEEIVYLRFGRC